MQNKYLLRPEKQNGLSAVDHLLSNGKYIAVIGMEKFMDAQFEKSARCNVDYDKEGTPRKGTRYVSPAVIQI